jgi:hypothetical protein
MEAQEKFQFPILTIQKLEPLLSKGDKVFAYKIMATTERGNHLELYENTGLDLSNYIGAKVEFLLEITKGKFEYMDDYDKNAENTIIFQYEWHKRLNEYFPELIKISNDLDEADDDEEGSLQELFETTADRIFKEWGLNGLNIGIYQAKPLLSSHSGFFFLNEYEFEEEVDFLELDQKVYIQIDEIYLRGIRPYLPDGKEYKREEKKEVLKQKEPEQREEPKETKKSKFTFLA